MGFRFRRSIRLAPGLRINLSKSGASVSVGHRGASMNFGSKGEKITAGLPGTGLAYSKRFTPHVELNSQVPADETGTIGRVLKIVVALAAGAAILIAGAIFGN